MAHDRAPMKAATLRRLEDLALPKLGSPKFDGLRCLIVDGVAVSNNLKPFRNRYVQAVLGYKSLNGLDGELVVGDPWDNETGGTVLNRTRACTAIEGEPEFTFWVFDRWDRPDRPFAWRHGAAEDLVDDHPRKRLALIPHTPLATLEDLVRHEAECINQGYEGTCYRHPAGRYKHGRATPKEDLLWKFKRFIDGEGTVIGLKEAMRNENEAKQDELGRPKRSTAKAGKVGSGMVGTIVVRCVKTDDVMELGPGKMTLEDRIRFFRKPELLVGQLVTWRAFDYGVKDALRHATFHSIRPREDL